MSRFTNDPGGAVVWGEVGWGGQFSSIQRTLYDTADKSRGVGIINWVHKNK